MLRCSARAERPGGTIATVRLLLSDGPQDEYHPYDEEDKAYDCLSSSVDAREELEILTRS